MIKRFLILIILSVVLWATPVEAALAVDSVESGGTGHNSTTSPLTWSFTNTNGNLLIVGVVVSATNGTAAISGVTYGGAAMTAVPSSGQAWDGDNCLVRLYYKTSPATGANNVEVTWSSGAANPMAIAGAVSFSDADTTTPVGTAANASGSSAAPSVDVTSTTSGNIVIDSFGTGTSITEASEPAGQTLRWRLEVGGASGGQNAASATEASSGGTVTMSHVVSNDIWGITAVEVKAAAGGGTPTKRMLLLGI